MTSLRADDYGLIALTPPVLIDFSVTEATLQFDISTLSVSQRDWFGIVIQPWNEHLPMPIAEWLPDLNGFGRRAIHFDFHDGVICPVVYREFSPAEGGDKFAGSCRWWDSWEQYLSPSAQQSQTIKITLSSNRIKIEVPEIGLVWDDMKIDDLGWNKGVVSLLHHSYTPFKDGNGGPNTWHWDNVQIVPAQHFTIIRSDKRWVNQDNTQLTFNRPAPKKSFLRGSVIGTHLEISFDNGINWEPVNEQAAKKTNQPSMQFWHPIPSGTQSILLRSGNKHPQWWSSNWIAKDISLFSLETTPEHVSDPKQQSECAIVKQILRLENSKWTIVDSGKVEYNAVDCISEQPDG